MILVIQHIPIEGPALIGQYLKRAGFDLKTVELDKGDILPEALDNIEAVLCLGGPMNVYEEDAYPFLKEENIFIQKIIKREIPFLGICLGAQLLAKACGAKVVRASKKEIGWFKINLTEEGTADPLFKGMVNSQDVFQWHGDTFDIPAGYSFLATAETCKNQAFRSGKRAYGIQFHIEVTEKEVSEWSQYYREDLKKEYREKGKKMLDEYYLFKEKLDEQVRLFCKNFISIIKDYKKKEEGISHRYTQINTDGEKK